MGISQFLRLNDILSGFVGKKSSIISKEKQICSQKIEEGRQLTFVQQISSYTVYVVLHLG